MAVVVGYPQKVIFCPECGNARKLFSDNEIDGTGRMECPRCGCRCYIVEAEDSHAKKQ